MSFLKYSVQTFAVRFIVTLMGLSVGVFQARWLGPEGMGICALLMVVPILSFRFGNLGFGTSFAFFVASKQSRAKKMIKLAWSLGLVMSLLTCLILLAIRQFSFSPWKNIDAKLFYLILPTVPIFFLSSYLGRILSGLLRIYVLNLANIVRVFVSVFLTVLLVVVMDMGVKGAAFAYVISELTLLLYYVIHLSRKGCPETGDLEASDDHVNSRELRD